MGLGSGGNPLGYEGKAAVPGKERGSTEVGWKPVTVLRVLETASKEGSQETQLALGRVWTPAPVLHEGG